MARRHHQDDDSAAPVGGAAMGSGSRVITTRGPLAWLLVTLMAAPWGVGMYVIIRAVIVYLSHQPSADQQPPRTSA